METIEKMARLCMRDPDEDEEEGTDEEDVEEDDELLVRAQRPGEMGQGGWAGQPGVGLSCRCPPPAALTPRPWLCTYCRRN